MAYDVISLGTVSFSSAATASPVFAGQIRDAESVLVAPTTTATSTGGISVYHLQVEMTDTGSNWANFTSSNNLTTAAAAAFFNLAGIRIRLATSGSTGEGAPGVTFQANKRILV